MKKKKLTWMLALIVALMTTACSNDENIPGSNGSDNGVITFTVTPDYGVKTRAIDIWIPNGKALRCIMEVYEEGSNTVDQRQVIIVDRKVSPTPAVNFKMQKKPGKRYTAAFWADFTDATDEESQQQDLYYDTSNGLDAIALNSSNTTDFDGEAFYKNVAIDETGEATETNITLKHAVEMMNLKTIAALDGLKSVTVIYGTDANAPASSFNAVTGKTGDTKSTITKTQNISLSKIPTESEPLGFHTFYVFAPEETLNLINMSVTMCVKENGVTTTKPIEIPNVPIRANYVTNVTSNFSLLPTNFYISCDRYYSDDLDAFAWNVVPDHDTTFGNSNNGDSESSPYIIATANQLAMLAANVNTGKKYKNKYFKMTADIDLGDLKWAPIGNWENRFEGSFDGNSYSVKGLLINSSKYEYAGLFGCCNERSSIKNLHVNGKVTNNAKVGDYFLPRAGGIVGTAFRSNIENCSFSGTVNCPDGHAGGIVGYNYADETKISCCKNTGAITGKQAGGIAGYNQGETYAYYEYCYNTGKISGTEIAVGISQNMNSGGNLSYCYNIGEIEGANATGALVNTGCESFKDSYCKKSYKYAISGEKVFSEENWPKPTDTGWKAGTDATGTDDSGYWKSLGGWNGGVGTEYPKLWWEK